MAWIRVDQSLRHHRKLIAFANELGVETATATGHLVLLWLWCLDNAPTGILKRINGQQISTACAWSGNPNDLVNALLSAGFLDKCGRGGITLRIHDWYEYAGKLLETRAANRERMQRARAGATVRNGTVRNETKENVLPPPCPPKRGTAPRQKNNKPLSGKYRDKVIHG